MKQFVSKSSRTIIAGLIVSAALAGCAVGLDYVAPKTTMVPFHNTEAVANRQTTLPAPKLDSWWTGFNDPMPEKVVQRALDQNLSLQAAIARVSEARASIPALRVELEAQLNRFDVLMGVQPGTYAAELGTNAGAIPDIPAIGTGDQPVDVLRRRPDIIAAERHLAATNEEIGVAIADYFPKISLSGALGFDSITSNHFLSAKSFQPVGTGALQWRLFDFGKVDAEVKQARGANAEALAQYREAALKATEDVEDAFVTLSQTELRAQELQQEVTALTKARDLSEKAYRAGSITLTDGLDADR